MSRIDEVKKILKAGTVIPANPLAITADRKFNPDRQRALMRYYMDSGVGGLAIAVHTTQFKIRDPEIGLFEPVLKVCSEEIDSYEKKHNRIIVKCAGVCGKTEQAINEALLAKKYGYDAVLLSPGGLADYTEEQLLDRTRKIAEIIPVIGFYLQPSVGGRIFTYNYWSEFASIDNVIAIKCASFNRYQTLDVVRAVAFSPRRDDIALFTGNDDNIVVDLLTPYKFNVDGEDVTLHFVGGLLGHWCVWTKKVCEMFEFIKSYQGKDEIPATLLTLAEQVTDCNSAFFDTANSFSGCIAGVHEVLRRQGLMEGIWCLDPDETLSPGQKEEIDRVYKMYPHLNDDEFVKAHLSEWLS